MTLLVSPQASEDLKQAYQYIAKDNVQAADRVLARIVEVIGMLAAGVVEGRKWFCGTACRFGLGPSLRIGSIIAKEPISLK